jgi:hypothetical protein
MTTGVGRLIPDYLRGVRAVSGERGERPNRIEPPPWVIARTLCDGDATSVAAARRCTYRCRLSSRASAGRS